MRLMTAGLAASVVTALLGGMFVFCRTEPPVSESGGEERGRTSQPVAEDVPPNVEAADGGEEPRSPVPPISPTVRPYGSAPAPIVMPDEPSAAALDLAEIRARVGTALPSGWGEAAKDDDAAGRSAFVDAVEVLEAESHAIPAPAMPQNGPLFPSFSPVIPGGPIESPLNAPTAIESLRSAVRDLSQAADAFEEEGRYDEADRLRRLAERVRKERRRLLTSDDSAPESSVESPE